MIGASDPEWVQVSLLLAGRCVVEQDGRRSVLSAGDFASWASSRPYAVDAHTQHDLLVTYCPEPLLRASRIGGADRHDDLRGAGRGPAAAPVPAHAARRPGVRGAAGTRARRRAARARRRPLRRHGRGAACARRPAHPRPRPHRRASRRPGARPRVDRRGPLHLAPPPRPALRGRRADRRRDDPRPPAGALPARPGGSEAGGRLGPRHRDALGVREPGALQPRLPRGLRHDPREARQTKMRPPSTTIV